VLLHVNKKINKLSAQYRVNILGVLKRDLTKSSLTFDNRFYITQIGKYGKVDDQMDTLGDITRQDVNVRTEVEFRGIKSMSDEVRCGTLQWFGHVDCNEGIDWVKEACRYMVFEGVKDKNR